MCKIQRYSCADFSGGRLAYYKRGLSWEDFKKGYLEFLKKPETQAKISLLIDMTKTQIVTVLCVEDNPEFCHRKLLLEEIQRLDPNIKVIIF
jgi:uncharacterized protein YeaO (DUF488 family)